VTFQKVSLSHSTGIQPILSYNRVVLTRPVTKLQKTCKAVLLHRKSQTVQCSAGESKILLFEMQATHPCSQSYVLSIADLLLDDGPTLLDDLDEGVRLPLPDVTSPDWLDGIGNSSGNKGTAAGEDDPV